ncbi:sensor domain-containing protein [Streptosporangium sandarakinum]
MHHPSGRPPGVLGASGVPGTSDVPGRSGVPGRSPGASGVPRVPGRAPDPLEVPLLLPGDRPQTPRSALRALAGHPLGFLRTAWPWRSLAYLLSGAAFGAVPVLVVWLAVAVGPAAAVAAVAVAAVPGALLAGRYERWLLRLVETAPIADPHAAPPAPGPRAWLRTRLGEQATWRETGHTLLAVIALWWIDLGFVGVGVWIPGLLLSAPLQPSSPLGPVLSLLVSLGGVALLPLAAYPVTIWAGARATLVRTLLSDPGAELAEITRSRARLADAFEAERRRIERDLHDGAQQRLVALTLALGMARLDLPDGSPAADRVAEAHEHALLALAELRELIRGIHPPVLTDLGLPDAVLDLAGRSPVPVETDVVLPRRPPPAVEITAYFTVSEALTNVARHSGASRCLVRGRLVREDPRSGGILVLEVHDDGDGGADPAAGTGLAGLADRLAVVGGVMSLSSPAGGPTLLRVEIPCP